jgi:hypothetical protein
VQAVSFRYEVVSLLAPVVLPVLLLCLALLVLVVSGGRPDSTPPPGGGGMLTGRCTADCGPASLHGLPGGGMVHCHD